MLESKPLSLYVFRSTPCLLSHVSPFLPPTYPALWYLFSSLFCPSLFYLLDAFLTHICLTSLISGSKLAIGISGKSSVLLAVIRH